MLRAVRNIGRPGIASMAIAAVDAALWDLKARLLGLPLATLLGAVRDTVPIYGKAWTCSRPMRGRAGITGFLKAGVLCEARSMPLSAHCAPSLHVHPACAVHSLRHIEYFHDHARIEQMLFDGVLTPVEGRLWPDLLRPGLGIEFKHQDARRYAIT